MSKIQIRRGVFETNSSSVHSLTMTSAETYDKWVKGELLYCIDKDNFLPIKEAEQYNKTHKDLYEPDYETYITFDAYNDIIGSWYETFNDTYEQNGEKIVAFGYFGHD